MYSSYTSEVSYALTREGLEPGPVIQEAKRVYKEEAPLRRLERFIQHVATPIDGVARTATDFGLYTLSQVRRLGYSGNLFWWERSKVAEDEKSNRPQKDLLISALSDQIFPEKLIDTIDLYYPGFGKVWKSELHEISEELPYTYLRSFIAKFMSSTLFAASTGSLDSMSGVIGFRLATSPIEAFLTTHAYQSMNRLRAINSTLGTQLNQAASRCSVQLDGILEADALINGFISGHSADVARWGAAGSQVGLIVGTWFASLSRDGLRGVPSAIAKTAALVSINYFWSQVAPNLFSDTATRFGENAQALHTSIKEEEIWAAVSREAYIPPHLHKYYEKWFDLSYQKNLGNSFLSVSIPSLLAAVLYSWGMAVSYEVVPLIAQSTIESLHLSSDLITKHSMQRRRNESIKAIDKAFMQLDSSWGPPTLQEHSALPSILESITPHNFSLQLDAVSLPPIPSRSSTVLFEENFVVNAGQRVVLFGGNKSGKSTLMKTLAMKHRGDSPNLTDVRIAGLPIQEIPFRDLRKLFLYVPNTITESYNLRAMVGYYLLHYNTAILNATPSKERIRNWVLGKKEDLQIERAFIRYLRTYRILPELDESAFSQTSFSAAQQVELNCALSMSINDPVVLFHEEPDAPMEEFRVKMFARFCDRRLQDSSIIHFVTANKADALALWFESELTMGSIDMREEVSGKKKDSATVRSIANAAYIEKVKQRVLLRDSISAEDFNLVWQDFFVSEILPEFITQHSIEEAADLWLASEYSNYFHTNLAKWLDTVNDADDVLNILYAVNKFYWFYVSKITFPYMTTMPRIAADWSPELQKLFVTKISPIVAKTFDDFKFLSTEDAPIREGAFGARIYSAYTHMLSRMELPLESQFHYTSRHPPTARTVYNYIEWVVENSDISTVLTDRMVIDEIAGYHANGMLAEIVVKRILTHLCTLNTVEEIDEFESQLIRLRGVDVDGVKYPFEKIEKDFELFDLARDEIKQGRRLHLTFRLTNMGQVTRPHRYVA